MQLAEVSVPAVPEKTYWQGSDTFTLQGGDTLKIESDGVEHLEINVPEGETRKFKIAVYIEN